VVVEMHAAVEQAEEAVIVVVKVTERLMGNATTVEGYGIMLETVEG